MKKLISIVLLAFVMSIANVICGQYVYPSGGEEFINGDTITVSWNNEEMPYPVKIDLWNLNTLSYTNLAINHIDSTFSYIIEGLNDGATLRIRVSSLSEPDRVQFSQTYFDVAETPMFKINTDKEQVQSVISIFPNPTNGLVNVPNLDINRVELFDAQGVFMKSIANVNSSIDISDFPAGQYNLIIYLNDNSVLHSAVIKL